MNKNDIIAFTVFLNSIIIIAVMTLYPFNFHIEKILGTADYRVFLIGIGKSSWSDVRNNLILFFPFGFSIAWLQQFGWLRSMSQLTLILSLCLLFSSSIEMLQHLIPGRCPSLIDVFANTAGGGAGYVCLHLVVDSCKDPTAIVKR